MQAYRETAMRVGVITCPMLFQAHSALRDEVHAMLAAFERLPSSVAHGKTELSLVEPLRHNLDDYDVIHVLGVTNGNHVAVDAAAACGVPVVLTPLIGQRWCWLDGWRARLAAAVLAGPGGVAATEYDWTRQALCQATLVLARSRREMGALRAAFPLSPGRVRLLPPALADACFAADAALFRQHSGMAGPFALMANPIDGGHEQMAMAAALGALALPLVVIGAVAQGDGGGLRRLRQLTQVRRLAHLDFHPRLRASVFAAASMFIDAGAAAQRDRGGAAPGDLAALPALAALAAGTVVVAPPARARALPDSVDAVRRLRWDARRRDAIVRELRALRDAPPVRELVRASVAGHRWPAIATRLAHCYVDAIALRGPVANVFVGSAGTVPVQERAWR